MTVLIRFSLGLLESSPSVFCEIYKESCSRIAMAFIVPFSFHLLTLVCVSLLLLLIYFQMVGRDHHRKEPTWWNKTYSALSRYVFFFFQLLCLLWFEVWSVVIARFSCSIQIFSFCAFSLWSSSPSQSCSIVCGSLHIWCLNSIWYNMSVKWVLESRETLSLNLPKPNSN